MATGRANSPMESTTNSRPPKSALPKRPSTSSRNRRRFSSTRLPELKAPILPWSASFVRRSLALSSIT